MCRRSILVAIALAVAFCGHAVRAEDATPIRLDSATDAEVYCSRVQAAFTREDFATLEATAERARTLTMRLPGGKPELQVFYESFVKASCHQTYVYLNEDTGKSRAALAERWLGRQTNSMTARIASAMIWDQFAWTGRGGGFAQEVSAEQWTVFSERTKHAAQFMRNVDPDQDAQAYLVLLDLARDLGMPRPELDTVFRRARQHYPAYLAYYADYATILMPKWFGQPGDLADYMASLLANPGGEVGAMAYARAAERIAWDLKSSDPYRDAGLTWVDVRRGFAFRQGQDGLDKHAWISLCYYAVMAGDRVAAREAYSHVTHLDEWPGGGTHPFFLIVLPWIMERE